LTDEFVEKGDPVPAFGFTGAYVGVASYDMTERAAYPAFDWFEYRGDDTKSRGAAFFESRGKKGRKAE
jgi:hypothetical protein